MPKIKILYQGFFVAAVFFGAFLIAQHAQESEQIQDIVQQYGYGAILVLGFISGLNLVIPIPAIAFLPLFIESGLDFYITIIFITLGMTCADSVAYAIGNTGRKVISRTTGSTRKVMEKLEAARDRYTLLPLIILFLFAAFAPLPNEVLLIPMGILGYRFVSLLPVLFIGNIVFNIVYSSGVLTIFEVL